MSSLTYPLSSVNLGIYWTAHGYTYIYTYIQTHFEDWSWEYILNNEALVTLHILMRCYQKEISIWTALKPIWCSNDDDDDVPSHQQFSQHPSVERLLLNMSTDESSWFTNTAKVVSCQGKVRTVKPCLVIVLHSVLTHYLTLPLPYALHSCFVPCLSHTHFHFHIQFGLQLSHCNRLWEKKERKKQKNPQSLSTFNMSFLQTWIFNHISL